MAFDTPGVDTPQLVQVNLTNILRQAERREEAGLLRIQVLAEPDTEEQPLRAKLILGLIREKKSGIQSPPQRSHWQSSAPKGQALPPLPPGPKGGEIPVGLQKQFPAPVAAIAAPAMLVVRSLLSPKGSAEGRSIFLRWRGRHTEWKPARIWSHGTLWQR